MTSTLAGAKIPPRFIHQREGEPTGVALVDETVEGGFELYFDGTATVNIDIDEVPETVFVGLEWVHLGGVLLAPRAVTDGNVRAH